MREQCENNLTLTMVIALTTRVSAALQENIEFSFLIFQCYTQLINSKEKHSGKYTTYNWATKAEYVIVI